VRRAAPVVEKDEKRGQKTRLRASASPSLSGAPQKREVEGVSTKSGMCQLALGLEGTQDVGSEEPASSPDSGCVAPHTHSDTHTASTSHRSSPSSPPCCPPRALAPWPSGFLLGLANGKPWSEVGGFKERSIFVLTPPVPLAPIWIAG
jgi:hypothetical protein